MVLMLLLCFIIVTGFESQDKKNRADFEKSGYVIWEVKTNQKKIALTFDDGPNKKYTEEILDLLKLHHAKATFFVIGYNVKTNPELLRREFNEGHEIGNHTYQHLFFDKNVSLSKIEQDIKQTGEEIKKVTGEYPTLFRPPGGLYSERTIQLTKQLGYTTVLWSWHQDTNDWRHPGVQKIVKKVLTNARNGDIVLMHDFNPGSDQTVRALKIILPVLIDRGFQLVTVSELMESAGQEIMLP